MRVTIADLVWTAAVACGLTGAWMLGMPIGLIVTGVVLRDVVPAVMRATSAQGDRS